MGNVFVISDLHLGHKKILEFSPQRGGNTTEEHDEWIVSQWNSVVGKRDIVYTLGDVAFSKEALRLVSRLKGQKILVRGNHDQQSTEAYLEYFSNVYGIIKKYGVWFSHAPVHPVELRGRPNAHGHVHDKSVIDTNGDLDLRYVNCCVEVLNGVPMALEDLLKKVKET